MFQTAYSIMDQEKRLYNELRLPLIPVFVPVIDSLLNHEPLTIWYGLAD